VSSTLPPSFKDYFWDVRFGDLDLGADSFFITKRILDRGNTAALKWVLRNYGREKIREVITKTRDLDAMTATFWSKILEVDPQQVPCLHKPYSPIHFGLYS
jgi:hypothetical protein